MTRKRLILLLESFRDGLDSFSLSQAQILTLGVQAGIAKNSAFMQVVNGHSVKALDDAIRALNSDDRGDDLVELSGADDDAVAIPDLTARVAAASRNPEPAITGHEASTAAAQPAQAVDMTTPPAPAAGGPQLPATAEQQKLPVPMAGPVLRSAGTLLAAADADAAEYLIASSVEQLWKAA